MTITRSPVGRVIGYGSTGEGLGHWIRERVTALALVPLGIWFVVSAVSLTGADWAETRLWLASPWHATLMILTVALSFWHAQLGVQVVIEDYVNHALAKPAALLANIFILGLLGTACVVAVLKVSFGSAASDGWGLSDHGPLLRLRRRRGR